MKMTLDNPAILEQKLEALEHHKRVLENQQKRRQQLSTGGTVVVAANQFDGYANSGSGLGGAHVSPARSPKPLTMSSADNGQQFYENMPNATNTAGAAIAAAALMEKPQHATFQHGAGGVDHLIYSNIVHTSGANRQPLENSYSNISYHGGGKCM